MVNQAKKGGEYGVNSEFYKGGQFLPSNADTEKGKIKIKAGGKKEIEPYKWEKAPADNMLSIWDRLEMFSFDTNKKDCEYVKGVGFVGFKIINLKDYHICSIAPYKRPLDSKRRAFAEMLIEKFNNGERWFNLSDDPFHYLNKESH